MIFRINYLKHLVTLIFLIGCDARKSDPDLKETAIIEGKWVNKLDSKDQLIFGNNEVQRIDLNVVEPHHKYKYALEGDSISLQYNGTYYIHVAEKSFKFSLSPDRQELIIEGLSYYFPNYDGDVFIRANNK